MSVYLSHYAELVSWPLWKVRSRDKVSLLTGLDVPEDGLIEKNGRSEKWARGRVCPLLTSAIVTRMFRKKGV